MRATLWLGGLLVFQREVPEVVARELALTGHVNGLVVVSSERLDYAGPVHLTAGVEPPPSEPPLTAA